MGPGGPSSSNCYGCRLGPVPLRSLRNRVLIRLPLSWSDLKTIWVEEISIEQRLQNILPGSIKCPTQSLIILGSLMEVLMNACISVNQSLRSCKLWQAFPTSPIVRFQRSIVLFREAPKFSLIINFMTFRISVYIWNSYLILKNPKIRVWRFQISTYTTQKFFVKISSILVLVNQFILKHIAEHKLSLLHEKSSN